MSIAEKLTQIADKVPKVYDAGGKAAENKWWNNYEVGDQSSQNWEYRYAGAGWHRGTFKPRKNIRPMYPQSMFARFDALSFGHSLGYEEKETSDLVELLTICGITLDFSLARYMDNVFNYAKLSRVGVIDCSSAASLNRTFDSPYIEKIDKWILGTSQTFPNTFANATALESLTVEGTIANSISFVNSPLDLESAKSVIDHLEEYYNTPGVCTVTFSDSTKALLDAAGAVFGGLTWDVYVTANLGWNC